MDNSQWKYQNRPRLLQFIDDESYENVKKFWKLLRLKKLSELNDIYYFQDMILLCEIFENRAREMIRKFLYNPQKCSSTSSLSGYIHRFLSKSIITLPTQTEIVDLFEFAIQIHNLEMFCLKCFQYFWLKNNQAFFLKTHFWLNISPKILWLRKGAANI